MSAAAHDQAAGVHEAQAGEHQGQFNPTAQKSTTNCGGGGGNPETLCWTDVTNPSQEHQADAEKHRKMAADHRAASQALRDAEARACVGLSNDDRDISPFEHRQDIQDVTSTYLRGNPNIENVAPSYVHVSGKSPGDHLVGATVTFRAVPGLTAEWLQRVVDCHIARNNALGNVVPEMAYCPLVPKGVSAKVSSAGNGFAVQVESSDPKAAEEILRRATALKQ
jgi:hypothetical protein